MARELISEESIATSNEIHGAVTPDGECTHRAGSKLYALYCQELLSALPRLSS